MSLNSRHIFKYQFWRILDHISLSNTPSDIFSVQRKKILTSLNHDLRNNLVQGTLKKVDIVKGISDDELRDHYIKKGIPVVIKGKAKNWLAVKRWSPEWLLENYCNDMVSIFDTNVNSIDYSVKDGKLKDVLLNMLSGNSSLYSRFNRILYDHPDLINDFDWRWLYNMRSIFSSGKTFQVFIGGKGTKTTLHAASENNLFTQIYGKKHWYLYPPSYDIIFDPPIMRAPYFHSIFDPDNPDFNKFPNAKFMDTWECELSPGDILYNPPSWWHHVTNLDNSIGVGFRWFNLKDSLKMSISQTLLTALSTNPPIWYATKNRTDFAKIFRRMNKR